MIDLQLRILFTHSRHHRKTTPYRQVKTILNPHCFIYISIFNLIQGMHEILGVIIYLIHLETLKISEYQESNELMKKIYDPQYLEHDA
jgi:hypothetical protein